MEERIGEAFELGEQLTVAGKKLQPGEPASDFIIVYAEYVADQMREPDYTAALEAAHRAASG